MAHGELLDSGPFRSDMRPLQESLLMSTSTIHIDPLPTHCSVCGAEYRNIQHPLKPPGVIMQRLCDCKLETTVQNVGPNSANVITRLVPPEKGKGDL
jgi:hypothetical protein